MICAHKLMDIQEDIRIHLISESFEIGMYGEGPGLITPNSWPILRPHWISDIGFDHPGDNHSAVKSSWLRKAVAIALSGRGARFHTGTKRKTVSSDGKKVHLSYPGGKTNESIEVDHIVDTKESEGSLWNGAVVTKPSEFASHVGLRPDGTFEIWWKGKEAPESPLQLMEWVGEDPSRELLRQSSLSETKLSNLKITPHRT